jgi:nifR3 family TIM-barrel protein
MVFTEVVTAEGLWRKMKRTLHYLESVPGERPVAAHVYGATPECLAGAAQVAESLGRFDAIDINCGCPARKVVRKGAGVALMRDPDRLRGIVEAVRAAVSLPVTVKTRLGLSPDCPNLDEVAHAVEAGGAAALFVHARFASDYHSGPVDLEALRRVREARGIPVIGNGGVRGPADAVAMRDATGVDGVMIGRGAVGNPWVFAEIRAALSGRAWTPPSPEERMAVIEEHLTWVYALVQRTPIRRRRRRTPESASCRAFGGHLAQYVAHVTGRRRPPEGLLTHNTPADTLAAAREVLCGGR